MGCRPRRDSGAYELSQVEDLSFSCSRMPTKSMPWLREGEACLLGWQLIALAQLYTNCWFRCAQWSCWGEQIRNP
jgi:hypothetical protein